MFACFVGWWHGSVRPASQRTFHQDVRTVAALPWLKWNGYVSFLAKGGDGSVQHTVSASLDGSALSETLCLSLLFAKDVLCFDLFESVV